MYWKVVHVRKDVTESCLGTFIGRDQCALLLVRGWCACVLMQ